MYSGTKLARFLNVGNGFGAMCGQKILKTCKAAHPVRIVMLNFATDMNRLSSILLLAAAASGAAAQTVADDSLSVSLGEVNVTPLNVVKLRGASNSQLISAAELKRAACCNLGESFTTNPSVDVNYSDAATGARQIRLLGLSGQYVQMLTENIPNFRGAAAPYGLGYVPGPWMQSIQVSKGASSVKNGYESITGQINVEMKKPQADPSLALNMYYDMMNKLEANADGNLHFGENWSAGLLAHYEDKFTDHDGNGDGFADMPKVRQISAMPRVAYLGRNYVFQAAAKFLDERRRGGQTSHHRNADGAPRYRIDIDTRRWEGFAKNAYIFDRDNSGNVALIVSASHHDQDALYGERRCDIDQTEVYASLMFERKWADIHALSAGASLNHDRYRINSLLDPGAATEPIRSRSDETVGGAYAQYTLNLDDKLVAMGGVRLDHSSRYGAMFTPRMHLRYNPLADLSFHASAGKGYRSPHPLAEYSYLLASSRQIDISGDIRRESAWNFGIGGDYTFHPFGKRTAISAEYYHTSFTSQLMANLDMDPHAVYIYSSSGKSYSHAFQVELTVEPAENLTLSAAWRLTDVKADYTGHGLTQKPLTSRHKALFSAGFSPNMGLWQFDVTCALNGSGRMPTPYRLADGAMSWSETYRPYVQLNAQITRNFRHWAIYAGGENLTNYRQPHPIAGADNPWGESFDATMIYGPLQGAMVYVGFRYNITKYL